MQQWIILTATKGAHMMRLAIAADMPALVNVPATATGISGICRVPSWRIKPKGLLVGRLRLLLLRLLWLSSTSA